MSVNNSGFATIPTILTVSVLILVVAFGIAASTFTETVSSAAEKKSAAALRYAEAGVEDALMLIARDKNYVCATVDCYSSDMVLSGCANGAGCARVSVSAGAGSKADPKIVTSAGVADNMTRKLEASVIFDAAGLGEIGTTTWREIVN
jgi:Tfp pilus assembly protein PilX